MTAPAAAAAAAFALLFSLAVVAAVLAAGMHSRRDAASSAPASGYGGAVSTTNTLATEAAIAALRSGGNAADAAAVAQFVLNVVQPESTGIGGGAMGLVWRGAERSMHAIDGREEAPEALTPEAFCEDANCTAAINFSPQRCTGGHPVGVPGTLAAVERLLSEHGTFSLAEAVAPAVGLARDGFPAAAHLVERIGLNAERLAVFEAGSQLFLDPEDPSRAAFEEGQLITNPDLADTLEAIGELGSDWFYRGGLAEEIVAAAAAAVNPDTGLGGLLTLADLDRYRAVEREPVRAPLGGESDIELVGHAPPTSGGVALLATMSLLRRTGAESMVAGGASLLLRLLDAQAVAYADKVEWIADADWEDVPVEGLLDDEYLAARAAEFLSAVRTVEMPVEPGTPPGAAWGVANATDYSLLRHGTTHISVADGDGNCVAWTTTIEENMGSAVVVPGRGFLLNNELTDFDGVPGGANEAEGGVRLRRSALGADALTYGGKRPASSMAPTMALRLSTGDPVLLLGSPGGSRIVGTVSNVLANHLLLGMALQDAVDAPRVISRNFEPVDVENAIWDDAELMAALEAQGVVATNSWGTRPLGFVQAVAVDPDSGLLTAAADGTRLDTAAAAAF